MNELSMKCQKLEGYIVNTKKVERRKKFMVRADIKCNTKQRCNQINKAKSWFKPLESLIKERTTKINSVMNAKAISLWIQQRQKTHLRVL